jgi:hypothetical protein
MTTDVQRESAKIYAFPSRARNTGSSVSEQPSSVVELTARRLPRVEFGSGWYHEAALEEARQDARR